MTAFNIRTTPLARNALLAACAAITLGTTAAHADFVSTGASGYWTAFQDTRPGTNTCAISTGFGGQVVTISADSQDQRLRVGAYKQSWSIPSGTLTRMSFQVDGNQAWRGLDPANPNDATGNKNSVWMTIDPTWARELVHQLTSGTTLRLYFSGTEQPWTANLSGTTGVWPQFMNCMQMVAPAVIASLTPTQPFVAQGPAQPFPPAPRVQPAPPSQPFNRI